MIERAFKEHIPNLRLAVGTLHTIHVGRHAEPEIKSSATRLDSTPLLGIDSPNHSLTRLQERQWFLTHVLLLSDEERAAFIESEKAAAKARQLERKAKRSPQLETLTTTQAEQLLDKTKTTDDVIKILRKKLIEPTPDWIKRGKYVPAVRHGPSLRNRLNRRQRLKTQTPPQLIWRRSALSDLATRSVRDNHSDGRVTHVLQPLIDMDRTAIAERLSQGPRTIADRIFMERQRRIHAAIQRGSEIFDVRTAALKEGKDPDQQETLFRAKENQTNGVA